MSQRVEVNDEVYAVGQNAHFVVVELNRGIAVVKQFSREKATGRRIYVEKTTEIAVGALKVRAKDREKPLPENGA